MKRKTAGRVAKPRICAYCRFAMAEQRPVVLVVDPSGDIVGPFHSGCAEKLILQARRDMATYEGERVHFHKFGAQPREETLPW